MQAEAAAKSKETQTRTSPPPRVLSVVNGNGRNYSSNSSPNRQLDFGHLNPPPSPSPSSSKASSAYLGLKAKNASKRHSPPASSSPSQVLSAVNGGARFSSDSPPITLFTDDLSNQSRPSRVESPHSLKRDSEVRSLGELTPHTLTVCLQAVKQDLLKLQEELKNLNLEQEQLKKELEQFNALDAEIVKFQGDLSKLTSQIQTSESDFNEKKQSLESLKKELLTEVEQEDDQEIEKLLPALRNLKAGRQSILADKSKLLENKTTLTNFLSQLINKRNSLLSKNEENKKRLEETNKKVALCFAHLSSHEVAIKIFQKGLTQKELTAFQLQELESV